MSKIKWDNDLLDSLWREKVHNGKSLKDLQTLLFSTMGINISQARISQVLQVYQSQFNTKDKIEDENRNYQE